MVGNPGEAFLGLEGRRILITGAGGSVGRAVASLLASEGAICVLHGRDIDSLESSVNNLEGSEHRAVAVNLESQEATDSVLDFCVEQFAGLDGVVHCIGRHLISSVKTTEPEDLVSLFQTNASTALMVARSLRRKSVPKVEPSLVFIGSILSVVGEVGTVAYAASKGALLAMTKSLALELARDGIRVNYIAAGALGTGMLADSAGRNEITAGALDASAYPLGLGTVHDVANSAAFLLSSRSRWMTGTSLVLDGGYTAA